MPLYGHELNEAVNPYAAGLGWAVKLDKGDFVGRDALRDVQEPTRARSGSACSSKASGSPGREPRSSATASPSGLVTSGTFSPTLEQSLAMALVDPPSAAGRDRALTVDVRGHREPATVVKLPFYRRARQTDAGAPVAVVSCLTRHFLETPEDFDPMDPKTLRFSPTHEWVHLDGDVATVGISRFAVDQLTDLIMIDLPAVGTKVTAGKSFGEVESVKAVSDLYAPVSGEVVEVNSAVADERPDPRRRPVRPRAG